MGPAPDMNLRLPDTGRAEDQNPAEANYKLALHFRDNNEKGMAEYHIHLAASQGHEQAIATLDEWRINGYIPFDDEDEAIRILEEAAGKGIKEAQYQLGQRVKQGCSTEENPERSVRLFAQSAEQEFAPAMFELGNCLLNGDGIEPDSDRAVEWFSKAAHLGNPDALVMLGLIHRQKGEPEEAVRCFERAAELESTDALFHLAVAYGRGEGVPEDEDKMRSLTAEAARKGMPEAQYWLGTYYRYGQGSFAQDLTEAAKWFERASFADHPQGTYLFGLQTLLGKGVDQDISKGWDLIEKAAKMDVVDAMMALGTMIDSGDGPVDDPETALHWYQRAADKGSADAALIAGKRMMDIPNDRRYVRQYLDIAAQQGNEEAESLLAGLPQDYGLPKAPEVSDVTKQAIAGDAQSQYQLGFGYFMGIGFPRSMPLSYFWFSVLARTMPPQAEQMLQMLNTQLSAEEREEMDKHLKQWQPGMPPPEVAA